MAIGATCVWEVRTTGVNTNGGGYTSGGTDYSQQDAAQYALTGVTSAAAGNTVLSASAAADMVGNVGCCVSGTNFTTSEFFEVASVVAGVSITFGTSHAAASICTGIGANGVINIGGAFKIGGTLDDEWFDSIVAGNTVWVKTAAAGVTYTLGEVVNMVGNGTSVLPITFEAYITARGTKPTGADRPTLAYGANAMVSGDACYWKYFIITTAQSSGFQPGTQNIFLECKNTNSGAVANYPAFNGGSGVKYISCEGMSYRGYAFNLSGGGSVAINCYAHDSKVGFNITYVNSYVLHSIVDTCNTGIDCAAVAVLGALNNVIYNCITGISGTTSQRNYWINNIISGCVTGALWTTAEPIDYWGFNNFYNTTDNTLVTLDSTNLVASNPLLGSGLVSGTDGATSASGLVFTAASAPFSGVTTADCLLIKVIGTGATLGVYAISSVDSTSQLTIATSAGASKTGITYGIVKGADFTLQAQSPCINAGATVSTS